jgi:hypothetical protein
MTDAVKRPQMPALSGLLSKSSSTAERSPDVSNGSFVGFVTSEIGRLCTQLQTSKPPFEIDAKCH